MLFPAQRYKKLQNGESRMKIYSSYFPLFQLSTFNFQLFFVILHRKKEKSEEKTHLRINLPGFGTNCHSLQVCALLQLRLNHTGRNSKLINSKFKININP